MKKIGRGAIAVNMGPLGGKMNEKVSFTGREKEIAVLREKFLSVADSRGSTVMVSGEAGIGKTRLVNEFTESLDVGSHAVLYGAAFPNTMKPFLMFSRSLEGHISEPLFREQAYISFSQIFAIDTAGLVVAKATPKCEDIDPDIFAGMFSAVQDFISDSFSNSEAKGLGRLDYGEMGILIEHGEHIFLTAIFRGKEHPEMKNELKKTLEKIEEKYGYILEDWRGSMDKVAPIERAVLSLAEKKFLVRRDIEGVKLEAERIKIANRILKILKNLSGNKPVLLVLEDLHWADESSLFVLQYIARNITTERILIISTLRPNEEGEIVQKYLEKMRAEGTIYDINLKNMERSSMRAMIDELYPENLFADEFVDKIAENSDGNPLFLIEFMRNMEEDGSIEKRDGKYVLTSDTYSIPSTLEEIVEKRLENLGIDDMMMAEYTACMGRVFDKSTAFSINAVNAEAVMNRLQSSGIISVLGDKGQFVHGIFQEFIYSEINPRWKAMYHRNIGEYYEEKYRGREDEVIYELATHFGRTKNYEKAFDYSVRAGEKAESTYAAEQAEEAYGRALALIPDVKSIDKRDRELDMLVRLGEIYMLRGKYDESIENYSRSLEIAERVEKQAELHDRIANALEKKGEFDDAMAHCNKGLSLLENTISKEKTGLLIRSAWINYRNGKYEEATEIAGVGLKMAEEAGDRKYIALANHTMGSIMLNRGDYKSSLKSFNKALEIRERLNDE